MHQHYIKLTGLETEDYKCGKQGTAQLSKVKHQQEDTMAIEISVISVGAVFLVVLLLMVLICTSGQSDTSVQEEQKESKSTGNYLFVVFICSSDCAGCTDKYFNFIKI